jgi:hypothetical protein
MDVRYEGGFHGVTGDSEPDLVLTNNQDLIVTFDENTSGQAFMGMLSDLLAWHEEDPVHAVEIARNEVVASFQENRNPFIDHPEWVACVYQGLCESQPALLLNDGRFKVTAFWQTPEGDSGVGHAQQLTADTGYFWFFRDSNVEVVVKVLNGCSVNQHFWFFAGGLTNVFVVITVEDTETGLTKPYTNPQRTAFQPIQDTRAFATCDMNQGPQAGFTWSCKGYRCQFTDTSNDPDGFIVDWLWSFGDGMNSISPDPLHQYAAPATYPVQLTVEDDEGATNSASRTVGVQCVPAFQCCRVCSAGKACGDTCIASHLSCQQGLGCACNAEEVCP